MARKQEKRVSADTGAARSRNFAREQLPISPLKLWCFRAIVALGVPLLLLLVLETGLRLAGFGYPTSFLLSASLKGHKVFTQNDRFGWRFFGPSFARRPASFAITQAKPPEVVRVFIFGESAAYGDPQPEFGLARMLQAMLGLRYPGVRFEVVNAAMTAINSHAIVPIARDCARAGGDVWVLYMGNNEVVGPFGAGTVFGPQAARQALIQASLTLKTTRTGQLLDSCFRALHPPPADQSEWGGMLMFLNREVRLDDARMAAIYEHFQKNLGRILKLGHASGAGIVVSSVAVNLRDCAPFASQHRPGLSEDMLAKWRESYRRAREAQANAHHEEALGLFYQAEHIDDSVAELQFVIGQSCLALGRIAEAQRRFGLARDLDVLRFRCDSRLNGILRRLASNRQPERILFADAEQAFARQSPEEGPGAELFYEHVHLTFEGNYLLARTIASKVVELLPEWVRRRAPAGHSWPAAEECARRLAWTDFQRLAGISQMLGRLSERPFSDQLNHDDAVRRLRLMDEQLRPAALAAARQAEVLCREALEVTPDDAVLHEQRARLLMVTGDSAQAAQSGRRAVELLPSSVENWMLLGEALARQREHAQAIGAFNEALHLDPENVWALQAIAEADEQFGKREDAMREYRRALRIKPRFGPAWLGLGQLLERSGQKEQAEKDYRLALKNRIYRPGDLARLARFCQNRGWLNEALTNYLDAIRLSPSEPTLYLNAGQCLNSLSRNAEAERYYAEALRLAPASGQAHFLYGLQLGREDKPAEATEQFREAVRLMPQLVEARLNLAIALMNQGRHAEALDEFRQVLSANPTNAIALRNVERLSALKN